MEKKANLAIGVSSITKSDTCCSVKKSAKTKTMNDVDDDRDGNDREVDAGVEVDSGYYIKRKMKVAPCKVKFFFRFDLKAPF